jgi:hypothetical protein
MGMQSYGSAPGRRSQVAGSAPARPTPKPQPLIATAMKRKAPSKKKGS